MQNRHILLLFLCLCCFSAQETFAQKMSNKDMVHLIGGRSLKGEIIHYEQGGNLILRIKNGVELKISDTTIDRIVQDANGVRKAEKVAAKTEKVDPDKDPLQPKTLYHAFYFSGNLGGNIFDDTDWGVGIEHVTGYWLNENWSVGLGGGIVQYSSDYSWRVAPVFADVKLKSSAESPFYFSGDVGIGFPLANENLNILSGSPGERFRLGVGKIWKTHSNSRISAEFSYLHQRATFDSNTWGWWSDNITSRNMRFKRYHLRFGFLF